MPYSRAWTNNTPLGSTPANQIDDEVRNLRQDIQERMDDLLGAGKWATSPIGSLITKQYVHGAQAIKVGSSGVIDSYGFRLAITAVGNAPFIVPLKLPPGVSLTDLTFYVQNFAANTLTFGLYKIAAGVRTQIGDTLINNALSGEGTISLTGLPTTIADDAFYVVEGALAITTAVPVGGSDLIFHGLRLTYTKPSIFNSL